MNVLIFRRSGCALSRTWALARAKHYSPICHSRIRSNSVASYGYLDFAITNYLESCRHLATLLSQWPGKAPGPEQTVLLDCSGEGPGWAHGSRSG